LSSYHIIHVAPYAAAFKPNVAFFEALGPTLGLQTLRRVMNVIPSSIPVVLDVKRGDIGTTAQAYAEACYEKDPTRGLGADAVTLSPLMGYDSIQPFITGKYVDRGAFLLCKTSNPGSNDLLTLNLSTDYEYEHNTISQMSSVLSSTSTTTTSLFLYEKIASLAQHWSDRASKEQDVSKNANASTVKKRSLVPSLGLVVGATDIQALQRTRCIIGDNMWILAPGIGAQGGDLDAACRVGLNSNGSCLLIPVSRAISQAPHPGLAAKALHEAINVVRNSIITTSNTSSSTTQQIHSCSSSTNAESITSSHQHEFIDFCLNEGVLKFGSFVLKSGRTSPYFFNAGLFSSGRSLFRLGQAYATAIMSCSEM